METTAFRLEKEGTLGTWVSRKIDGKYFSALVSYSHFYKEYQVFSNGTITHFKTEQEAIEGAKSIIISQDGTRHLEIVNEKIEDSVREMNRSISQRIAKLRGKLFGQMCKLQSAIKL